MPDSSRFSRMILAQWTSQSPALVEELRQRQQLQKALLRTQERTANLLHQLVAVQKLSYLAAWEIILKEWELPPSISSPSQNNPETSG